MTSLSHRPGLPRPWTVRWRDDGRHLSRGFTRKADAQDFQADLRRRSQLGAHAPVEPSKRTLRSWLEEWWDRESPHWARSNLSPRGSILDRWIEPYLGDVRLRDLGPARIAQWRSEILRDATPQTWNKARSILSAALGAAVRDGLLPSNPVVGTPKAPHRATRPRVLTPHEIERIRFQVPNVRDRVLVDLMGYAGLRPEEAIALRWGSVGAVLVIDEAFTAGELRPTKTGNRRTVEVIANLREDLDELRDLLPAGDGDLVAPAPRGGYLSLQNWRARVWHPARVAAKVAPSTPYDLRHSFASLLIHEGRSPILVAAAMGHSSAETTWRHYAHLFDGAAHTGAQPLAEAAREAREVVEGRRMGRPKLRVVS